MSQSQKKVSQKDLIPFSVGETVALIALERIDTAPQIRTEFEDESLQELAQDIKAHGVIQPIIVRQVEEGRFLIIAGERRFRASQLAETGTIPALIRDVDAEEAQLLQLAENIQREELDLMDAAKAVRLLFDREKNLGKVAALVKKSKPWVSKHLALTMEGMHHLATNLLRQGATEDMEIINLVNRVAMNYGEHEAWDMVSEIRAGNMNRAQARAYAKEAKARFEAPDPEGDDEDDNQEGEGAVSHAKRTVRERDPSPWDVRQRINAQLDEYQEKQESPAFSDITGSLSEKEICIFIEDLQEAYNEAKAIAADKTNTVSRLLTLGSEIGYSEWQVAAAVLGYQGRELTLENLIQEVHLSRQCGGE